MKNITSILYATLLLSSAAHAQKNLDPEVMDFHVSVGFAGFTESSIYLNADQRNELTPYVELSWGPLFLEGDTLGSYLYGGDNWGVAITISHDMFGDNDRGDSKSLSDMVVLDNVYNASLYFIHESVVGELSLEIATDVSDNHNGNRAIVSYSLPLVIGRWTFTPDMGAEWFSEEISQYYVGVTSVDVKPERALYKPQDGINYSIGFTVALDINLHHSLGININHRLLSNEVSDSPIVEDSSSTSAMLSYLYSF